jgi:hypothetical protein
MTTPARPQPAGGELTTGAAGPREKQASTTMTTGKRGRPKKDFTIDPDLPIAELAIALQAAWGLSERRAIDLALALMEGSPVEPSKMPRGRKGGLLVGYQLPNNMTFAGRAATIRRKLKWADRTVTRALAIMLTKRW